MGQNTEKYASVFFFIFLYIWVIFFFHSCRRKHRHSSCERRGRCDYKKKVPFSETHTVCSFVTVTSEKEGIKMPSAQDMLPARTSLGSFPLQAVTSKRIENVTQRVNA